MNLNTDVDDVRYEIVPYEVDRRESQDLGGKESESDGCGTATDTEALPDYNEILVSQIIIEESVDLQLIIDSERFRSLVKSIDEAGFVMNPVHVRSGEQGVYHLITGRQRYLAAKLLGCERIRALVTDENPAMVIFKDNVLRGSVTVIEEAEIYDELRRSKVPDGYTQAELAALANLAQSTISDILSVMKLPKEVRDIFRFEENLSREAVLDALRNSPDTDGHAIVNVLKASVDSKTIGGKAKIDPVKSFLKKIEQAVCAAKKLDFKRLNIENSREICENLRQLQEQLSPIVDVMKAFDAMNEAFVDEPFAGVEAAAGTGRRAESGEDPGDVIEGEFVDIVD